MPTSTSSNYEQSSFHATAQAAGVHPLMSLKGTTSLVTGGARGIGLSLATALVSVGSNLVVLDILPSPSASHGDKEWAQLELLAKQSGLRVDYIHGDITNEDSMMELFSRVSSECLADGRGPLKTVLHAAAIMKQGKVLDFTAAEFDKIMQVNVTGTFIITKAAAQAMKQHGGSIVLMASISGFIANRGLFCSAYNSSKAAVHQFCRSAAVELAEYGIRVNTISPGYIRSKMTDGLLQGQTELRDRWEGDNALQRMGTPDEIQGALLYFATQASSYTTGTDIRIDGGVSRDRLRRLVEKTPPLTSKIPDTIFCPFFLLNFCSFVFVSTTSTVLGNPPPFPLALGKSQHSIYSQHKSDLFDFSFRSSSIPFKRQAATGL